MVTIRTFGRKDMQQVSLEDAQKIIDETYNNPVGGIVVDARTHEVVSQITPEIEEVIIIEQMLGGG
jgi:hypothetical protein